VVRGVWVGLGERYEVEYEYGVLEFGRPMR
jgi:phage shock protein PspC (stress-responsive transcriptional regulator)